MDRAVFIALASRQGVFAADAENGAMFLIVEGSLTIMMGSRVGPAQPA